MRQPTILLLFCTLLFATTSSPEPRPTAGFRPGKDHAILFAINTYKAPLTTLINPITNARQIATELENRFGFKPQIVENPSAAQIEAILNDYANRFARNLNGEYPSTGQLFIFFSGHGTERLENGYFLPANADMNNLRETGLQYSYLRPLINAINCQHILVAVDACYSVTFDEDYKKKNDFVFSRPGELSETDKTLANHNQYKSRVFFTSDAVGDMTPDKSNFAKKLLEGLRTFNAQNGFMTSSELFANYLQKAFPTPHGGEFGADEAGSTFLFFSAQPKPVVDPTADVRAWNEAKTANTLEAYRAYLRNFAQGEFRELAESRVKVFEQKNTDYANWQKAKLANIRQAYEQYLRENPKGNYRDLAEAALQRLNAVANTQLDTDKDGVPDGALKGNEPNIKDKEIALNSGSYNPLVGKWTKVSGHEAAPSFIEISITADQLIVLGSDWGTPRRFPLTTDKSIIWTARSSLGANYTMSIFMSGNNLIYKATPRLGHSDQANYQKK